MKAKLTITFACAGLLAACAVLSDKPETAQASCEGIFCSCSGPADSNDCKKLTGCADDVACIGNDCGCIGGSVGE